MRFVGEFGELVRDRGDLEVVVVAGDDLDADGARRFAAFAPTAAAAATTATAFAAFGVRVPRFGRTSGIVALHGLDVAFDGFARALAIELRRSGAVAAALAITTTAATTASATATAFARLVRAFAIGNFRRSAFFRRDRDGFVGRRLGVGARFFAALERSAFGARFTASTATAATTAATSSVARFAGSFGSRRGGRRQIIVEQRRLDRPRGIVGRAELGRPALLVAATATAASAPATASTR